ncbi:uncharacterized protein LOC106358813 isoform X1 [Brassica napus]|uniref:uncharacterized protein LOC106358813 isoform X1 n=1 Tax=Brassica napus TaxID=3708 RepID=UPI002078BD55|nr:uncharacterized protein LOC106358813 isoform X1 [Brassica napus]
MEEAEEETEHHQKKAMGCDGQGKLSDSEFSKPLPWIGVYVAAASLICGLAMFADLLRGFRNRRFWFPCKSFSLNATTLTFLAVCVKLSVDLNTCMPSRQDQLSKLSSNVFVCTVMANSMPSLGFMVTQDLLMNLVALGILVVTDVVNICIQLGTGAIYVFPQEHALVIVLTLLMFVILTFSAITVPATKRFLELKYKKSYELALKQCPLYQTERRGGFCELKEDLMKFWMMAHTCSPQFVMARSVTCTTSGFLCFLSAVTLSEAILRSYFIQPRSLGFCGGDSDYKWSTTLVLLSQAAAVAIGTVAPASRWFTAVNLQCSSGASKSLRDELRVESYWVESLSEKKEHPLNFWMLHGRRSRKLAHDVNRCILDLCIAIQYGIVFASKLLRFIAVYCVSRILLCCHFTFRTHPDSSSGSNPSARQFVLHLEGEEELVDYMARSNREATNHLIQKGRKKQPQNLIDLLEATDPISKGFEGILEFDSDEVGSLAASAAGEPPNCWALPLVTLTSIAASLPNINPCLLKKLVKAVNEALVYVKKFEDVLDIEGELANSRKAAEVVWLGVDLYHKWLKVDLEKLSKQQRARPQEVFKELEDIAKKEFSESWEKNMLLKPSRWPIKILAANSMYRISQTLTKKYESRNIGTEDTLFREVERMVSDIVAGCFCNTARVVGMQCLVTAVEVREASVREAAMHLGRTEKILEIVDRRCIPALSHHKVAKIDGWREFYKTNKCIPSSTTHPSTQCTTRQLILTIEK